MISQHKIPTRSRKKHVESESLWVISYADLLMVLLSFFVVYFEMNSESGQGPMWTLMAELKSKADSATGNGGGGTIDMSGSGNGTGTVAAVGADLKTKLESVGEVIVDPAQPRTILVHLKANSFKRGAYKIENESRKQLDEVFRVLKPYRNQVSVVFMGHSDFSKPKLDSFTRSNLVLSNLRASAAADYAVSQGFEPKNISTQGFAEFNRATRSLSIQVTERSTQ